MQFIQTLLFVVSLALCAVEVIAQQPVVEHEPAYPLWLPEPGASSKADLNPRAEEARQRGLKAAGSSDWKAAVVAFKEANAAAHASPALMFNLALAYQRGGWPVPAAMYYRAYLAALPAAPNAAEVRNEIKKLIAETEARSQQLFDEAELLADKLAAKPPSVGAKSLRQLALEDMAFYAYTGGLTERGLALERKALSLPGAADAAEKREYPDKHGLYAAAYSWDARRVEDIAARFGGEYEPERIFNYRTYAWGKRGDLGEVRKIVDADPPKILSEFSLGSNEDKASWIRLTRGYEIQELMHGLRLDAAKELYVGTLPADLQDIFWNGRPDIAQRLARRSLEQYRKLYPDGDPYPLWTYVSHLVPNALLGDRKAIVQEMRRWKSLQFNSVIDDSVVEITALLVVASMAPADAEATIMDMVRLRFDDIFIGTKIRLPESGWPNVFPMAYFAHAIARGDSMAALKYLEHGDAPTDEKYQTRLWRALRFAVAAGRSQLALDLIARRPQDAYALFQLNRLAANPGASESVREWVNRYAASMSGGWRPIDAQHARRVLLHLRHAKFLDRETQYGALPEDVEKLAKEKPEQVPASLAGHAIVLWMGAMAARLED